MKDPITGAWLDNHSCPKCRYRHPKVWSCAQAAKAAEEQRDGHEPAEPIDVANEAVNAANALLKAACLPTYSDLLATIESLTEFPA